MKLALKELGAHPMRYGLFAMVLAAVTGAVLMTPRWTGATLRAGYAEFAPYVLVDERGGPAGLAVQMLNEAAARTGVRLQWIPINDAEKSLVEGRIDIYPILTVTEERKSKLYASVPWWEASQSLLSLRDHPLKDAAATKGRKIAIRDVTFGAAVASARLPGANLVRTHSAGTMISELCAGNVDGALLDARLIYSTLLDEPGGCASHPLMVVPLPQTSLPMSTFARPGVEAAASRLYAALAEETLDGTLTEVANQWFALPQQRLVQERLESRERRNLSLLFGAAALLLAGFSFWHFRRTLRIRRTAADAWSRAVQAERRFETFMAHTPAISFIKDPSGTVVYANDALFAAFGFTAAEAIGRTDRELWADCAAEMRDRDGDVLQTGRPVQYVLMVPKADGLPHHWLVLKFLVAGEYGQPLIGVTAVDITDQQRAADLVAQSEERYRLLFEEAPIAIHEIDGEGIVTRINRVGCQLCGYSREEIVGHHASDFVASEHREESRTAVREKLTGLRDLAPFERHYRRKDGRLLRVEVHETAILGPDGSIQGLRSCLVDLTERYEAQERLDAFAVQLQENNTALAHALESAREATRLKSQFLANMSHEIRTPMNGVLGMTELLLQSGLTDEQYSLAMSVSQSGEHLLDIINDILDFSKIESGKLELEAHPFDITAVTEAALDLMAPAAHAKRIDLTCWIDPAVPNSVNGDAARYRQVLLNLLGNAVKFTPSGEIAVHIDVDRDHGLLRTTVMDTGIGIPDAATPHLFAAFTQADNTTTRRFGGTGLGLAIARNLVELMGGEIGVQSAEGQGSKFWFTAVLPATEPPGEQPQLPDARVLIVDDSAASRSVLERYLRAWGLRTHSVPGARQALRALREGGYDLVLLDMQMPEVDGAALLRDLAAGRVADGIPVIRMICIGDIADARTITLRKPVKPAALREALCRAIHPAHTAPAVRPAAALARPERPSRGRILIAEDNPVNQRVARLQVSHCGFEADVVADGEEALQALERSDYALVLMDCQMPRMDGYAATREIRRREDGNRRTRVIALTANAFATDREACLEAGMDDHLSKPVSLRDLSAILDRWVDTRPEASETAAHAG